MDVTAEFEATRPQLEPRNSTPRRRGRPSNLSLLHRNIHVDDFKLPERPVPPPPSPSERLELLCRDGFSNMESVPLGRPSMPGRSRKKRVIAGMGQLTFAQGPKPSLKKIKCQRRMPAIDPELLAASGQGGQSLPMPNESPTLSAEALGGRAVECSITHRDSARVLGAGLGDILPSGEMPNPPASILHHTLRPRQPLVFHRTITQDPTMIEVTRYVSPSNDESDGNAFKPFPADTDQSRPIHEELMSGTNHHWDDPEIEDSEDERQEGPVQGPANQVLAADLVDGDFPSDPSNLRLQEISTRPSPDLANDA